MRGPAQAIEQGAVVGRGELALLDFALELLLDLAPLRVERPRRRLGHVGLEARARGRLGDSEPHLSGAENADLANLHVRAPPVSEVPGEVQHLWRWRQSKGCRWSLAPVG